MQRRVFDLKSEREAQAEERRLLRDLSAEVSRLEGKGLLWKQVIDRWEMEMRAQNGSFPYQLTTIQDHVSNLTRWTVPWLNKLASSLTKADGKEMLREMEQAGKSRNFRRNLKNTINVVYKWGMEERLILGVSSSPVEGIQLVRTYGEKVPDILTIERGFRSLAPAREGILRSTLILIWSSQ